MGISEPNPRSRTLSIRYLLCHSNPILVPGPRNQDPLVRHARLQLGLEPALLDRKRASRSFLIIGPSFQNFSNVGGKHGPDT